MLISAETFSKPFLYFRYDSGTSIKKRGTLLLMFVEAYHSPTIQPKSKAHVETKLLKKGMERGFVVKFFKKVASPQ